MLFALPSILTWDYWKVLLFDKFVKSYLKGAVDRIKGYTFFSGFLLTVFQVAVVILTQQPSSETISSIIQVLQVLIASFSDTVSGVASPSEINIFATSLLAIWGLILKFIKLYKQVPQVPNVVVPKVPEVVSNTQAESK